MNTSSAARLAGSLEVLETRIAPAGVFTFIDTDGDAVTVSSTRGGNADLAAVIQPFLVASGAGFQLQQVALANAPTIFQGTTLVISAAPAGGGNGFVDVGYINATGIDLGSVTIDGDLGQIDAGNANVSTPALQSLSAVSIGVRGLATQAAGSGSLMSTIFGPVGSLVLSGDLRDATVQVLGSAVDPDLSVHSSIDAAGRIGAVRISGSVIGGAAAGSGQLFAKGRIASLFIGGSILGGSGADSGRVWTEGGFDNATIEGDIVGGNSSAATGSGLLFAGGRSSRLLVKGELQGGLADDSGVISNGRGLGSVTILGGIDGGAGDRSGNLASASRIGTVSITGGITGGSGDESGVVRSTIALGTVNVVGDVRGDSGVRSGVIGSAETIGRVTIEGSIVGGFGTQSGAIGGVGTLGDVNVTGDLRGGLGPRSGQIVSATSIRSVTVNGSVVGGAAFESGAIGSFGSIGPVRIGADLIAGAGAFSGAILSGGDDSEASARGSIASITIGGDIDGTQPSNAGPFSAFISSDGSIGPVIVRGMVCGGAQEGVGSISGESIRSVRIDGGVRGGAGESSGTIAASISLGPVTIGSSLLGGSGESSGAIRSGGSMGSVTITGSITGGTGDFSGMIETQGEAAESSMGAVKVTGGIFGGAGRNSGSVHSSGRLASIEAGQLRGFSTSPPVSTSGIGSGSISSALDMGAVKINGNVTGGSGHESGKITSGGRIASLTISGNLAGGTGDYDTTSADLNQLGQVFAAGAIGPVRITGSVIGNAGDHSAEIRGASIQSVDVGGDIRGGDGAHSGGITSTSGGIGAVVLGGSLVTGDGANSGYVMSNAALASFRADSVNGGDVRALISARTNIGPVTISSFIEYADIFAGLDLSRDFTQRGTRIGTVTVGTGSVDDFTPYILATNIVASAEPGEDNDFGTLDDERLSSASGLSRIDAVIINGTVRDPIRQIEELRAVVNGSNFGIVADHVVRVVVNGRAITQQSGPRNDFISIGESTLTINELQQTETPV